MNIQHLINITHTRAPEKLIVAIDKRRKGISGKTHLIAFLMKCCGIDRLFDKTCLEEFLFRMGLLLKQYNILDTFFKKDIVVGENFWGPEYAITIDDLKAHLGMEVSNSPTDFIDQDQWLKRYPKYWKNACLMCVFGGTPIADKISIPAGRDEREIMEIAIDLNEIKYNNNVAFFATEVLRQIGNEPFEALQPRIAERRAELEEVNKKLNEKPAFEFDYSKISVKIKERFFEVICGPVLKNISYFQEVCTDPTSNFAALIHLSWLWDNDFVRVYKVWHGKKYSYTAEVDPRVPFQYDYYDGLHSIEFGVNLFYTYRDYNLEKLKGLLKEKR